MYNNLAKNYIYNNFEFAIKEIKELYNHITYKINKIKNSDEFRKEIIQHASDIYDLGLDADEMSNKEMISEEEKIKANYKEILNDLDIYNNDNRVELPVDLYWYAIKEIISHDMYYIIIYREIFGKIYDDYDINIDICERGYYIDIKESLMKTLVNILIIG